MQKNPGFQRNMRRIVHFFAFKFHVPKSALKLDCQIFLAVSNLLIKQKIMQNKSNFAKRSIYANKGQLCTKNALQNFEGSAYNILNF